MSGEGANAQHTLSINAVVILLVQDVTVQVLSDVWSQCIPHMRIGSRETSVSPTWHIQQYILNGIHLVHHSQISHVNFYLKLPVFLFNGLRLPSITSTAQGIVRLNLLQQHLLKLLVGLTVSLRLTVSFYYKVIPVFQLQFHHAS